MSFGTGSGSFQSGGTYAPNATANAYSPNLRVYLKCDDASGDTVQDYSVYGHKYGPQFAPQWQPSKTYIANQLVTSPQIPGKFLELTNQSGTSAATEPTWNQTVGGTTADSAQTWTTRAVPDWWSARTAANSSDGKQWLTQVGGTMSSLYASGVKRPAWLWDFLLPTYSDARVYTATTISSGVTSNTITDSASGFGALSLAAGDWVQVSGFATTTNNRICKISTAVAGTLTFASALGVSANEAAGAAVTVRKVLQPADLVISYWCNTTMSSQGMYTIWMREIFGVTDGFGLLHQSGTPIAARWLPVDITGGNGSITATLGQTSGTDMHWTMVIRRANQTVEFFRNGATQEAFNMNTSGVRGMCNLQSTIPQTNYPEFCLLRGSLGGTGAGSKVNGTTQIRDLQIYVGRNCPSILTGSSSPSGVQQLYAGTPITALQWPA